MKQYYYFVTSLPKITVFDAKLPVDPDEFLEQLSDVIGPKDKDCIDALMYQFDNINLLNIIDGKDEFVPFGKFTKDELIEEIKGPQNLPRYMTLFLERKKFDERTNPHLTLENELTLYYYNYLQTLPYPFLKKYIQFDYDMRNVATAITTKKYKLERRENVLKLNSLSDNLISMNSPDFGLIYDYQWLGAYLEMFEKLNLFEREEKLIEIRFKHLEDELIYDYFSINQIISFYLKLFLLNRKIGFDERKGLEIFERVTNDLSSEQNIFKDLNN